MKAGGQHIWLRTNEELLPKAGLSVWVQEGSAGARIGGVTLAAHEKPGETRCRCGALFRSVRNTIVFSLRSHRNKTKDVKRSGVENRGNTRSAFPVLRFDLP